MKNKMQQSCGERSERCLWQIQRGERVAAVEKIEEKRKPDDFFGHRNRIVAATSSKTGGFLNVTNPSFTTIT